MLETPLPKKLVHTLPPTPTTLSLSSVSTFSRLDSPTAPEGDVRLSAETLFSCTVR